MNRASMSLEAQEIFKNEMHKIITNKLYTFEYEKLK